MVVYIALNVRLWLKADLTVPKNDVRFAPESRHRAHLKFMRFPATPTAPRTTQTRTAYTVAAS